MGELTDEAAARYLARRDPVLARIIEQVGRPTVQPSQNLFGSLASSIIGQQVSVSAATAIRQRLAVLMPGGDGLTPDGILARSIDDLRSAGLSRQKITYLRDLAAKVLDRTVDLGRIADLDDETVIAELVQVRGIGRWTAEMFLIFALHRQDVLPVDDLGFRHALKRQYHLEDLPGPEQICAIAEPWRPYRSLGTWYLWQSRRNEPRPGSPGRRQPQSV